jgi:hypothetical protein
MSWSTSLLLAAVLWLDGGLRRVPAGSIILRRWLFDGWKIVEVVRAAGWRAAGRWPSAALSLVSSEPSRVSLSARDIEERLMRVRSLVNLARVIGIATSLVLVIGAPMAVSRQGRAGLYLSIDVLFVLGVVAALVAELAARRLGASESAALRFGATFLWPFAGPYAAERISSLAVAAGSPIVVARALANTDSFSRWARPYAYDALSSDRGRDVRLLEGFTHRMPRERIEAIVAARPVGLTPGSRFCPRCGATFRSEVRGCADCEGVELATIQAAAPPGRAALSTRANVAPKRNESPRRKARRRR